MYDDKRKKVFYFKNQKHPISINEKIGLKPGISIFFITFSNT
jgi:hypothetical protein